MIKLLWAFCFFTAMSAQAALAEEGYARATKDEAVAFVKKAIEYFKANGEQKAFAEFNDPKGKFIDRDLYIIAYDTTGITLAHGANNKLVGRYRLEEQDTDGVYYIKDRIEMMKTQSSFWQHYKFTDPLTHKILPKSVYCEVVDASNPRRVVLCSGVYDVR